MSDDLTDAPKGGASLRSDELDQIRNLSRLFGISFEELADVWRYNRDKRAKAKGEALYLI